MRILAFLLGSLLALVTFGAAVANPLGSVRSWLLLLNNDIDEGMGLQIAASDYDMVVIDAVSTQKGMEPGRSRRNVKMFRTKPDGTRRLVIAYVNIGQAEDYRKYWNDSWRTLTPEFILGDDPEGWAGNYPVAYWKPDWKQLIAGPEGMLATIQGWGFDGVYLDWIGGYEDVNVLAAAKRDGVDAAAEMVKWVGEISAHAKARNPAFLIVAQNAAGLLRSPIYTKAIDAVAHEDIWFTGADGGPDGDCPVPRTIKDVGSPSFRQRLNRDCRRAYRRTQANAMHYAGFGEIVPRLLAAGAQGLPVFTVDYALKANNVRHVMLESRALGFIPFAGSRKLDSFVYLQVPVK